MSALLVENYPTGPTSHTHASRSHDTHHTRAESKQIAEMIHTPDTQRPRGDTDVRRDRPDRTQAEAHLTWTGGDADRDGT